MMTIRLSPIPLAATVLVAQTALADPLPRPAGPVVLTVTGDISATNAPGAAEFDIAMMADIGRASFSTSTIWTEGTLEFTGTPLAALLDVLGIPDGVLSAVALNDYVAEIPVAEISDTAPLLAWQVDGEYLTVRNRGPVWIVYPYDSGAEFRSDEIYSRSVWQLARFDVTRGEAD